MSRKSLRLQLLSIDEKLASCEVRMKQACRDSSAGKPCEEMTNLYFEIAHLMGHKSIIEKELEKPTFIQIITGGGKR